MPTTQGQNHIQNVSNCSFFVLTVTGSVLVALKGELRQIWNSSGLNGWFTDPEGNM